MPRPLSISAELTARIVVIGGLFLLSVFESRGRPPAGDLSTTTRFLVAFHLSALMETSFMISSRMLGPRRWLIAEYVLLAIVLYFFPTTTALKEAFFMGYFVSSSAGVLALVLREKFGGEG